MTPTELAAEFDRQVENLLLKGYPAAAGLEKDDLLGYVRPLRDRLDALPDAVSEPLPDAPPEAAGPRDDEPWPRLPFVLVVSAAVLPRHRAVPLLDLRGRPGLTTMEPDDLARFTPIERVQPPDTPAYLAVDVDTGHDTLNVTPDDALARITQAGRSPLTVDEGIALVTHHPEVLRTHNCFSLLGSRCGDRRVTALWVRKGGEPRLGWCWAGNPHTWLGSASCATRVG